MTSPAARPGHRASGDPAHQDHRLLRLRRRRQDDHGRGPRRCARPSAARTVVVLTIDPARRLAQSMGLNALDNTPRPVKGVDEAAGGILDAMMLDMKRTFDEIVLAHSDPDRAAADPGQPLLPVAVVQLRRHAGVHGDGEARPAAGREPLGPHRRRHPAEPVRAGLPRRAAAARLVPRRPVHPDPDGAGEQGRPGLPQGDQRRLRRGHQRPDQDPRRPGAQDVQTFVAALDTMFGGFRERAEATYRLLQAPGTSFVVVAAPERDALREASYFVERLGTEGMPLAGLVLNRVHTTGARSLSAARAAAGAETLDEQGGHPLAGRGAAAARRADAHRSSGSSRCAAGSPPRTRRCRSSRSPRSRATCTTSTACGRSAPRSPAADRSGKDSRTGRSSPPGAAPLPPSEALRAPARESCCEEVPATSRQAARRRSGPGRTRHARSRAARATR